MTDDYIRAHALPDAATTPARGEGIGGVTGAQGDSTQGAERRERRAGVRENERVRETGQELQTPRHERFTGSENDICPPPSFSVARAFL